MAGESECDLAGSPVEEAAAQILFQGLEAVADPGGREFQFARGAAHVQEPGERHEDAQVLAIDRGERHAGRNASLCEIVALCTEFPMAIFGMRNDENYSQMKQA